MRSVIHLGISSVWLESFLSLNIKKPDPMTLSELFYCAFTRFEFAIIVRNKFWLNGLFCWRWFKNQKNNALFIQNRMTDTTYAFNHLDIFPLIKLLSYFELSFDDWIKCWTWKWGFILDPVDWTTCFVEFNHFVLLYSALFFCFFGNVTCLRLANCER